MTSEDADKIAVQLKRQADALDSIATSLQKLANPTVTAIMTPDGSMTWPTAVPPAAKITKEA